MSRRQHYKLQLQLRLPMERSGRKLLVILLLGGCLLNINQFILGPSTDKLSFLAQAYLTKKNVAVDGNGSISVIKKDISKNIFLVSSFDVSTIKIENRNKNFFFLN